MRALVMPFEPHHPTLLRPAAISVHDNRDMIWNDALIIGQNLGINAEIALILMRLGGCEVGIFFAIFGHFKALRERLEDAAGIPRGASKSQLSAAHSVILCVKNKEFNSSWKTWCRRLFRLWTVFATRAQTRCISQASRLITQNSRINFMARSDALKKRLNAKGAKWTQW